MEYQGQKGTLDITCPSLKDNPLGLDPKRSLSYYLPPKSFGNGPFPTLYLLAAWTNAGRTMLDWQPFKESIPEKLDRLWQEDHLPPFVLACPDFYTPFGGSQYVNSDFLGLHADAFVNDMIPVLEQSLPVIPGLRGVLGISSGGFGALRLGMDYPGAFQAVACHSGDMGFEVAYRHDLVTLASGLARFGGDPKAYLDACFQAPKRTGRDIHLLMLLGMAATYSPNLSEPVGFDLPMDPYTAALRPAIWDKWLSHDPVVRIQRPEIQEALKRLKLLHVECGAKDQFHLHFGARQFHKACLQAKVPLSYAEFDDNHSGLTYRFDTSLPLLLDALTP